MWNTVKLEFMRNPDFFNINQAINELVYLVKNYNFNYQRKESSMKEKAKKARRRIEKGEEGKKCILWMLSSNSISIRKYHYATIRKRTDRNNTFIYFINYKYYDKMVQHIIEYIILFNGKNIINNLYKITLENNWPYDEKTISNVLVPIQRYKIKDIANKYHNNEKIYLTKYYGNQISKLNEKMVCLDERTIL